jgi:hypothetical protein
VEGADCFYKGTVESGVYTVRVQVGGDVKMSLDLDEAIKEDQLIEQAEVSTQPLTDISP